MEERVKQLAYFPRVKRKKEKRKARNSLRFGRTRKRTEERDYELDALEKKGSKKGGP